jgi:hypothetical protein
LCILIGLFGVMGVCLKFPEQLTQDRDGYLALSSEIEMGHGMVTPGTMQPTAYRPPLYPIVIALFHPLFYWNVEVALINQIAMLITLIATYESAKLLGLKKWAFLPAFFVACDPLLLWYSAQPMTEEIAAMGMSLIAWMGLRILAVEKVAMNTPAGCLRGGWFSREFFWGMLIGGAVLCRPTFLIVGAGICLWRILRGLFMNHAQRHLLGTCSIIPCQILIGMFLALSPWMIRNYIVMGAPIVTTTHGGYTLYLANNPSFYKAVVEKSPWVAWELPKSDPDSQYQWWWRVQQDLTQRKILGERAQDREMNRLAKAFIADHPALFLKSIVYRIIWFWNIFPLQVSTALPPVVLTAVSIFYGLENLLLLVAIGWLLWTRQLWTMCGFLLLLIFSYEALHLVYWTNARMRAPVIPIVVLVIAGCLMGRQSAESDHECKDPVQTS